MIPEKINSCQQDTTYNQAGKKFGGSILYLLFSSLLLICYYNSFQASWHFDDFINILNNMPLHITDLSLASIKQTFFAYPEYPGILLRPVSNLSFALNGLWGQDKVFGYHLVNFIIHLLTTIFLYRSCTLLLRTPRCGNKYKNSKFYIAALAAIFWAVNPIQTQAVTYIVQRMASLVAMFYIIAIWSYLKGRLAPGLNKKSVFYYLAACLAFFLAICSKENGVLLPVAIILIELFFFQQNIRLNKNNGLLLLGGIGLIIICILFLVGPGFFLGIINSYSDRDFTLTQRALTEARIVVFYLSLLFYPSPDRLSLTHDIQLSTSLLSPPTTIAAVALLAILTVAPFFYYKRYPLACFAILFFLLNHLVESTVLNLELIFEHRNYLPSLFLFLPVAAALGTVQENYQTKKKMIFLTINLFIIVLIISLGLATIKRNEVWRNERNLWADSLIKAPLNARSYINLAHGYQFQDRNYHKAFELNYNSLDKYAPNPWKYRLPAYNNMAFMMVEIGNYEQAMDFYNKALAASEAHPESPTRSEVIYNKAKLQWLMGNSTAAMQTLKTLVDAWPNKGSYLRLYGELLIADGKTAEGINLLHKVLKSSSIYSKEYKMVLLDLSLVFARLQQPEKAKFYGRLAQRSQIDMIPAALCLLENSLILDQPEKAEYAMDKLLSQLTLPALLRILTEKSANSPTIPFNYPLLRQYALDKLSIDKQ